MRTRRPAPSPPALADTPQPFLRARQPRATPLRNDTLSQTIYDDVLARLQSGYLSAAYSLDKTTDAHTDRNQPAQNPPARTRLLDHEIAKEYGCTRTPARQALLRLVSEGYLQGTTRGFVLPTFSAADMREIFEIRRLLEPVAAASVTPLLEAAQLNALQQAHAQAADAVREEDAALLMQANIAFRAVWLNSLRNQRLLDTIRRFADHAQLIRSVTLSDPQTQGIVLDGLTRLYQGFAARQAQHVHAAMAEFVRQAEQHYLRLAQGSGAGRPQGTDGQEG